MQRCRLRILPLLVTLWVSAPGWAADQPAPKHGIAMHGEPKYGPDFSHFDYANPGAPKGGTIRLAVQGTFDSFNPLISKGNPLVFIQRPISATFLLLAVLLIIVLAAPMIRSKREQVFQEEQA